MTPRERRRIWFPDTSSLLSMAADEALAAAVLEVISADPVVMIDVVMEELAYRAGIASTATLAKAALVMKTPGWTHLPTDRFVRLADVVAAQEDVVDGRPLKDEYEHWAESTIIAMDAPPPRQATRPSRCSCPKTTTPGVSPHRCPT